MMFKTADGFRLDLKDGVFTDGDMEFPCVDGFPVDCDGSRLEGLLYCFEKTEAYRNLRKHSCEEKAKNSRWSFKNKTTKTVCHGESVLLSDVTFKHPSGKAFEEYYTGCSDHPTYKHKSVFAKVRGMLAIVGSGSDAFTDDTFSGRWQKLGCDFSPQGDRFFHVNGQRIDRANKVCLTRFGTAYILV
jgi:hypothetical protein